MGAPAIPLKPANSVKDELLDTFDSSRSHNLVFGMVGHAGSGPTWVAKALAEELAARKYKPILVQVSPLIEAAAAGLSLPVKRADANGRALPRPELLQNAGDYLRKMLGMRIGAALAVRQMNSLRSSAPKDAIPAFIVDSLKHPEEVDALRDVYGSSFYLVSVLCRETIRQRRLQFKHKSEGPDFISRLIKRDEDGEDDEGQHVRKTLHLADFFVANERNDRKQLADELGRFVEIVAGSQIVRPTEDERGMYAAWGASLRSACMSRQVGAAILDDKGNLIATGTNDPPRPGGGLCEEGNEPDHRCFAYKGKREEGHCRNDVAKQDIYAKLYQSLKGAEALAPGATQEAVRKAIEKTRVRDLIEFSRAVHAEMDAILSVARFGGPPLRGARLYCTTYPCHNCARGIVASGLSKVTYIEPYPKSLARDLHKDAITETPSSKDDDGKQKKVYFRLFSGVAPRRFEALFEKRRQLKDAEGSYSPYRPPVATHNDPIFSKSYIDFEKDVTKILNAALSRTAENEP